ARLAAELLPVLLGHVHAVMLRRLLDVGEGELAVLVGHPNRLIEAGDRVSDVARVGQRFLALFRKGEHAVRQVAALGETSVLLVGFPGGFHGSGSISRIMPRTRVEPLPPARVPPNSVAIRRYVSAASLTNRGSIWSRIRCTASAMVRTLLRGSRHSMPLLRMARTSSQVRIFRSTSRSSRASVVAPLATAMPCALQPRKFNIVRSPSPR